jgi:hypothetical protein
MAQVERETGLTPPQIIAAVDLDTEWKAIRAKTVNGHAPAPVKPAVPTFKAAVAPPRAALVADRGPAPVAASALKPDPVTAAALDDPGPAVEIDVPVVDRRDANATLARAEQWDDAGIQDAAHEIRALLAGLDARMDAGEKTRAVRAKVEALRAQLAQAESELAELGGDLVPTPAAPKLPAIGKPPSGAPSTAEVRTWVKAQGIEIAVRGRIPQQLRDRFLAERAKATT